MKKIVLSLILVAALLVMVGCTKKITLRIDVSGVNRFALTQIPAGINGRQSDNSIFLEVSKDGDYTFVLQDNENPDKQYNVIVKYHKGTVEVSSPEGLGLTGGVQK